MTAVPTPASTIEERVLAEQVRGLYGATWASRYTPFAALLVLLGVNWAKTPLAGPAIVFGCHALMTFVLELMRASYLRNPESRPAREWAGIFAGLSALAGTSWALATVVWFEQGNYESNALLCLVILAIATSSMITRSAYLPALGLHLMLTMGPLILLLTLEGSPTSSFTASLGFVYAWFLYGWAAKLNRNQTETIRLRFSKAELIEELKAANEAAEAARLLAEQGRAAAEVGERAKAEFLATVSHEIRTPLNAILGMSQILAQSDLSDLQRESAQAICEAGSGLKLIVDDIIDLSRIEAGKLELEVADSDIRKIIATVIHTLEPRAIEKNLGLSATVDAAVPVHVAADARRLRQVLINLVGNAVKFTDQGEVKVSVEVNRGALYFTVSDTGMGIAPAAMDRLFAPFSQVDQSYTRRHGGTGLGLAICQRLVTLMGGEIGVESQPDQGSTFWFHVPLVAGQGSEEGSAYSVSIGEAKGDDDATAQVVDTAQIARLGLSLGEATLVGVLSTFLETENDILRQVDAAVGEGDASAAAQAGQDLASASADLGLVALSSASRALAQSARDSESGSAISVEADSLRREAKRTNDTLLKLFPALAAKV